MTEETKKVYKLLQEARNSIIDAMYEDTMQIKPAIKIEELTALACTEKVISNVITNLLER